MREASASAEIMKDSPIPPEGTAKQNQTESPTSIKGARTPSLRYWSSLRPKAPVYGDKLQDYWVRTWLRGKYCHYNKARDEWMAYFRRFMIFIPHIWPATNTKLYRNFIGVGICLLASRVLKILGPMQLGLVVDGLTGPAARVPFTRIALYVLFTWLYSWGLPAIQNYLWYEIQVWSEYSIESAAYHQVMSLSSDFHDTKSTSDLWMSIQSGDAMSKALESILLHAMPFTVDSIAALGYLYYLFGSEMAVVVVVTTLLYTKTVWYVSSKKGELERQNLELSKASARQLSDTLGSWRRVAYFNRLGYERELYDQALKKRMKSMLNVTNLYYLSKALEGVVLQKGLFAACLLAALQIPGSERSVGDIAMLVAYWDGFTGPLQWLAHSAKTLQSRLLKAEDVLKIFELSPSISNGDSDFTFRRGEIKFSDVSFYYKPSQPILENITFTINPGQIIALVGPSGAGKTTILHLIIRFYDPVSGNIQIDGQNLKDLDVGSYRKYIGICPQKSTSSHRSILENVRYSKLDATDTEVFDACKAAAIHDQILAFDNGYDSIIGEDGVTLSGGQLQRLAFARAILNNPKILILDEPTSSVDTETEHQIQTAMHAITANRTTIIVAHRLSTMMDADRILVVENGTIAEDGSFEELLKAKGRFYQMWANQTGASLLNPESSSTEVST